MLFVCYGASSVCSCEWSNVLCLWSGWLVFGHFRTPHYLFTWIADGLRNGSGVQEGKLNMVASDQFSILSLLMPKEGLCEVKWSGADWGGCFATSGEQPGPSSLERKKYTKSVILINQVLHYCTSSNCFYMSCSVKSFRVVSRGGGLDCICEFRQRGQIVSWMATSKAVPPWGRTGRGGRALGPEDRSKSTLLFSSRWEGRERQERRWGAGASWNGGAGGHDCRVKSTDQSQAWTTSQQTLNCELNYSENEWTLALL